VQERPLYAGAAKDNIASLRVLQKCGFTLCGEGREFSNARGMEIEEYLLVLQADE
jgi:RimJ/RimL family protein N-acetyltransferase